MNIKSPCIMCVQYIGGYSVHRGIFSTSGVFSTLGEYHEYIRGVKYIGGYHECIREGGYHEYIGGCSVHLGDIMMHVGEYHEYIG